MKVSVAMATYNGEKYIIRQLNSILKQTRLPDEIIIIDDNSFDSTVKTINDYMIVHGQQLGSMQYKLRVNSANKGYVENFRYAMSCCSGDVVFTCDQDDIWEKDKIEKLCQLFEEQENAQLIATDVRFIDSNDKIIGRDYRPYHREKCNGQLCKIKLQEILEKNYFPGCTMAVRKKLIDEYLEIADANDMPHDWTMAIMACAKGGLYWYDEILINYRIHEDNTLGLAAAASKLGYVVETLRTWPEYCRDLKKRVDFVKKNIQLDKEHKVYINHMEEFTLMRIRVVNGIMKIGSYLKEFRIYRKCLTGMVDARGLFLDFAYIFIKVKKKFKERKDT